MILSWTSFVLWLLGGRIRSIVSFGIDSEELSSMSGSIGGGNSWYGERLRRRFNGQQRKLEDIEFSFNESEILTYHNGQQW